MLIVESNNELVEQRGPGLPQQPAALRVAARLISYIFHPVFIPVYIAWFLFYVHPWLFAGFHPGDKMRGMIMAFLMFSFFPVITVLLLKALKFIDSIELSTKKDRVIPLVASAIWYFWIWNVWRNLPGYPDEARLLALGIWISSWVALMSNIVLKISLHAIAAGVMLAFFMLLGFTQDLHMGIYISVALLVAGLVCTSRFLVSDHTPPEIYGGLLAGFATQCITWWLG